MIIFLMLVETIVLRMQSIDWNREQMSSTQMILIGIYRLLIEIVLKLSMETLINA